MPVELVFIIMAVILLVSCIIAVESEHFPIFGGGIVVDLMISLWVILSFQCIAGISFSKRYYLLDIIKNGIL